MAQTATWHNRIIGEGMEDADQLLANPRNARIHPKNQQDALAGVLDSVGWVQRVIVNQRTGFVVDGHLRISLAQRRGERVPVSYVDLTEQEEALILATFDPLAAMAATDAALLRELLDEVSTGDAAVMSMLSELAASAGVIPPDTFDPNAEWVGMPEFENEDRKPIKQILVSFAAESDMGAFSRLVEQNITMSTKSIWYPAVPSNRLTKLAYMEAEDAA